MKIRIEFSGTKYDPGEDYEAYCQVYMDGQIVASGGNYSFSSEDANLGRDLSFVYKIPDILKSAYEAGKRGDPFEIEEIEGID